MADEESIARYTTMKAAGASPRSIAANAIKDGLPAIEAIGLIRSLYCLSFADAREIVEEFREPRPSDPPTFHSWEQLEGWLTSELGYCGCDHFGDAIYLLRDVLRSVRDWEAALATKDATGLIRARLSMRERLGYEHNPGLATWFLYWLDHRGLLWHAGRVSECGLMEKGRKLLDAIERLYPPADEAEGGDG